MFNSLIFGLFFACGEKENDTSDTVAEAVDADGDGFVEADDCDDSNPDINPDAEELCDGVDNNCDDEIDNDATDALTFYEDYDEDGFGDAEITEEACEVPEGFVDNMDDCDDLEATVNPEATEVCDGMDNNCDGLSDDEDPNVDVTTGTMFYADTDGDGFGDEAVSTQTCAPVEGYVANMNDCDDTVENLDGDGDGFLDCKGDCDDEDAMTFPGAAESDSETECMRDADEDGFGDLDVKNCVQLEMFDSYGDSWGGAMINLTDASGTVLESHTLTSDDDCVDENFCSLDGGGWNGGSPEGYKSVDLCASSDELMVDFIAGTSYPQENSVRITDSDGMVWEFGPRFTDSSGTELPVMESATLTTLAPSAIAKGTDCDDADSAIGSGDLDGDGYDACDAENPTDCDDSDAAVNPSVDADADGFNMCVDCDETNAEVNPEADEVWYDGVDQNCDGWSDYDMDMDGADAMMYIDPADGETEVTWTGYDCDDDDDTLLPLAMEADPTACYEDADGDGYGDAAPSQSDMDDYGVVAGTDCYDYYSSWGVGGAYTYPGAAAMELDVDGDGTIDCTQDNDQDGYGDEAGTYDDFVSGTDCDDSSEFTYPGAAELEADPTLCMEDADEDGYGAEAGTYDDFESGTDCDDDDAALNPSLDGDADGANACEDCDDADASAQGFMAYEDLDGDGFGADSSAVFVCSLDEDGDGTEEYVADGGDCYDSSWSSTAAMYYPGAAYNEPDIDGDGIDDCTYDSDGDGYGAIGSYYADVDGTDCDDDDEYTFPGAGFNEQSPLDEECLTDADGDGYAAGIQNSLYEANVNSGDCFDVTIADSYSDGCGAFADMYIDSVLETSIEGPASGLADETTQWCASTTGYWQVGWTEDSSWNSDCELVITDSSGTELYNSGSGTIDGIVPGPASGGTDSDDSDSTTW